MAVTDEQALKLFNDIKDVCLDIIKDAHEFIKTHDLEKNTYYTDKYPGLSTNFFYDDKYFKEEDRQKIPFLKYKIPKYEMKQYPKDKKYYSLIFETYRTEHINLKDYKKIEKINDWINSETDILKLFTKKDKLSEYTIRGVVDDIVERYLYVTNATEKIPDDIDEMIKPYVAQRLLFYLENTLYFDICIPICLATFGKEIKLDENVEIIRISEELQHSKSYMNIQQIRYKDRFQVEFLIDKNVEECCIVKLVIQPLLENAIHMIVLHNYSYSKDEENSGISLFQDYLSYPLEKIDEIMGIVRLATGYEIGYEHIFCVPQDWIYETTADLAAVYGAKSHFVNHKYIKSNWINLPVSYVSEEQCDDIVALYDGYQKNEKRLKFSLMRYNRCVLREELDDITTDACIGLESLLAGGTHTEITNAIASRMPFVISKVENKQYLPTNGRKYMKKIYNLRSRIVHGDKLKDKDIYIENNQTRIYIPKMAVDFLRIVLVFMIKNPIYLNVEEIDGYIDSLVSKP